MNNFRDRQRASILAMYGVTPEPIVKSEETTVEKGEGAEKGPSFEDLENMNNLEKGEDGTSVKTEEGKGD